MFDYRWSCDSEYGIQTRVKFNLVCFVYCDDIVILHPVILNVYARNLAFHQSIILGMLYYY